VVVAHYKHLALTRGEFLGSGGDWLELRELRAGGLRDANSLGKAVPDDLLAIRGGAGLLGLQDPRMRLLGLGAERLHLRACVSTLVGQSVDAYSRLPDFRVALPGGRLGALYLCDELVHVRQCLGHHRDNGLLFLGCCQRQPLGMPQGG
jgi:hypothetical protein